MASKRSRGKIFHQIATNVLYCKHIEFIKRISNYVDEHRIMYVSKHEITSLRHENNFIGHSPDIDIYKSDYMYST